MRYLQKRIDSLPPGHPIKAVADAKARIQATPARGELLTTVQQVGISREVYLNDLLRLKPAVKYPGAFLNTGSRPELKPTSRLLYVRIIGTEEEDGRLYFVCLYGLFRAWIPADLIPLNDLSGPEPFDEYEWRNESASGNRGSGR